MIIKKNKKISIRRRAVTWFFVFLLSGSFLFGQNILAYTGDYNKAVNGSLSASEWNNLINDFVSYSSNGFVGIGSTTPLQKLDVFGDIRLSGGGSNSIEFYDYNAVANGPQVLAKISGNNIINHGTGFLAFYTAFNKSLTEKMRIDNAGNVGIGTTVPNDILSLASGGAAAPAGSPNTGHNYTSTYLSNDDYALANYGLVKTLLANATSSIVSAIGFWNGTAGGNVWNVNTGNIGIGTSSPAVKLDVLGSVRANGLVQALQIGGSNYMFTMDAANGSGPRLQLGTLPSPAAYFEIGAWGGINNFDSKTRDLKLFTTNGIMYMTNATGYIGIGTTVPNDIFSIANAGLAAPAGSVNTGHNYTSTYLSTDDYALANTGYVKTLVANATSTIISTIGVSSLFLTTATYNGNLATSTFTGYDAGNKICNAVQAGSHFCRTDEIISLIQRNGAIGFASVNGDNAWVADGPPGFTGAVSADDCGGYTDGTNTKLGHFWMFNSTGGGRGSLSSCDTLKKLTCCK